MIERRRQIQLDVELQTADLREIVFPRIEEHALEQRIGSFQRRRIAGTQLAIDFDQRFLRGLDRVLAQRQAQHHADVVAFREEDRKLGHSGIDDGSDRRLRQFVVRFDDDFAGLGIDDIGDGVGAFDIFGGNFEPLNFGLLDVIEDGFRDLLSGVKQHFLRLRMKDVFGNFQSRQCCRKHSRTASCLRWQSGRSCRTPG